MCIKLTYKYTSILPIKRM